MVVLILIDAFRWDYTTRTTFIQRLAQEGVQGNFVEPFGFVPREAYFGGLTPEEAAYTHMFHYDPLHSPFKIGAGLQYLSENLRWGRNESFRNKIRNAALPMTTPFGASYLSTLNIPLELLDQFDLSERLAPWEKGRHYTSIFDLLDQRDLPWFQCSWPLTNTLPASDDTSLTRHCISQIGERHAFAYVHLMDLDWCGHQHGAESQELAQKLKNTDRCVEALYQHCQKVSGGDLTFLIFGDHGMVNITRQIDLWAELQKSKLKLKHDYLCFLDSTMARFWFHRREARETITALLENISGGFILSDSDREHYHIANCPRANAELIYMAHPGVVIQPNFFDFTPTCQIKGMHGYAPECRDNQGALILHKASGSCGNVFKRGVNAWELFPILLDALKLQYPTHRQAPDSIPRTDGNPKPFTKSKEADAFVRKQLATAVNTIIAEIPQSRSIYITGGFGRGEGTVRKTEEGFAAVNDYDLGIIAAQPVTVNTHALGKRMASDLHLDYVDINLTGPFSDQWETSQLNFDIRHGSQILWGDPTELENLPDYHAAQIPVADAFKLICNRLAGILTTMPLGHQDGQLTVSTGKELYFSYQIIKTLIALGDGLLIAWGAYDVSYAKKKDRLKELMVGHSEFSPEDIALIQYGYEAKLTSLPIDFNQAYARSRSIPAIVTRTLQVICGSIIHQPAEIISLTECFRILELDYLQSRDLREENTIICEKLRFTLSSEPKISYRQRLYQLISCLCFSLLASGEVRANHWRQLDQLSCESGGPTLLSAFDWEKAFALQKLYIHCWETFCH